MSIVITLTSIVVITVLAWLAGRISSFSFCPICTGVAGTWAWLIVTHLWGYQVDLIIPAMLMGGTVVGVMSKLERFIEPRFVLVWKTAFIVSGFLAVNSLITGRWPMVLLGVVLSLVFTFYFKIRPIKPGEQTSEKIEELKKKMKNCC
ncbi:MAG: hypothetical protein AAB505_02265 [Patescibacteria group bacterium]